MSKFTNVSDDVLKSLISESKSWRSICLKLGWYPDYRIIKKLKIRVAALGIDISHFLGLASMRGQPSINKKPLEYFLVYGKEKMTTHKLKLRLFQEGVKKKQCEVCQNKTWMNKDIPLELHHVDGDKENNLLENLQVICPNCHAQTDNYRFRNKKK